MPAPLREWLGRRFPDCVTAEGRVSLGWHEIQTIFLWSEYPTGTEYAEAQRFARWLLEESPYAAEWVERLGNLAASAEAALLNALVKRDVVRRAMRTRLEALRAELAGPGTSAVERLLAERIALCSAAVNVAEAALAVATERSRPGDDSEQAALRRIEARHRMFLSAVRTLGWVRRLGVPALQVNVAQQQVNQQMVAGSHAAGLAARSNGVGPGQGGRA